MMKIFSSFPKPKAYKTNKLQAKRANEDGVFHRQSLIPGFDQGKMSALSVALVGAGGLGGEVAEGLVRKGVGRLNIYDPDFVELSNLSRQKFFRHDLYKNKALRLARNMVAHSAGDSVITGYPLRIEEAVSMGLIPPCDVALVLVDNEPTRVFCSEFFKVPLIFAAVGIGAERAYTMVQEPGKACYRCIIPEPIIKGKQCFLPACIDINKAVAAMVLYAVDSLFMGRKRRWNYKEQNLSGFPQDRSDYIERKPYCLLCGGR